MKSVILRTVIFLISVYPISLHAQQSYPQETFWANTLPGKSTTGSAVTRRTVIDAAGNMYATGGFLGSATFGSTTLTSPGTNPFLVKYSPSGVVMWAVAVSANASGVAVDLGLTTTSVVLTGNFSGTGTFNPSGTPVLKTSAGVNDIFIASFNLTTGQFEWVKTLGGTGNETVSSLAVEGSTAYVMGTHNATVEFNPEGPSISLPATSPSAFYGQISTSNGRFNWVRSVRSTGQNGDLAASSAGLFITSSFNSIIDFGDGIVLDGSASVSDIFFARIDKTNGATIWAKKIGAAGDDRATAIAANATDVYLAGTFQNAVDFNGGASPQLVIPATFNSNIFFARYEPTAGNLVYVRNIGPPPFTPPTPPAPPPPPPGFVSCTDMAISSTHVVLTGTFNQTINFNVQGTAVNASTGSFSSVFLARYPMSDGLNPVVQSFQQNAFAQAVTANDTHVVVCGAFAGTADFNNGVQRVAIGQSDAFVAVYTASTLLCANAFTAGSPFNADDFGGKIKADGTGNVFVSGGFKSGEITIGTTQLINGGGVDAFISKMDANGNVLWVKHLGGTGDLYIQDLAVKSSSVFVTGYYTGTGDFNSGGTPALKSSAGSNDIFLSRYDAATGNHIWTKSFGSTSDDKGFAVTVSGDGVYAGGAFTGTVNFNEGGTAVNLVSAGLTDSFIAKYDLTTGANIWARRDGGVNNDGCNGLANDASGVYAVAFTYPAGYASIFLGKYSVASGTQLFYKTATLSGGSNSQVYASGIEVLANTIVIAGHYAGGVGFDAPSGTPVPMPNSSAGSYDVFKAEFDRNAGFVLPMPLVFGGTGTEIATGLYASDAETYVTGKFYGTIAGGVPPLGINSPSTYSSFINRYSSTSLLYSTKQSGSSETSGTGISADATGVYLTGSFLYSLYLPTSASAKNSAGGSEIFVAKLDRKLKQTITFNPPATLTCAAIPTVLSATTDSQLPLTFSNSDNSVASLVGVHLEPIAGGTTNVTATQAGNTAFYSATATRTITVNKATQSIGWNVLPTPRYGGPAVELVAYSTNVSGSYTGLPVTFTSSAPAVATVSGNMLTPVTVGSTNITANQAGNACYAAAPPSTRLVTVYKGNPEVTFLSPNAGTYRSPTALVVNKGGSTGAVTFGLTNGTGIASISGSSVTGTKVGTVTISAYVAPDANYNGASATQTFTINKAPLTVKATSVSKTYGDPNPALTITYTGFMSPDNSSLFSPAPVPATAVTTCEMPGTYPITITPGGTLLNYDVVYESANLVVAPAQLVVTADNFSRAYNESNPTFTVSYTPRCSNSLDVVPTGSTSAVATTPPGTYDINVVGGSDPAYVINPVKGQLTITMANQSISFAPLADVTFGGASFSLNATSSSGLPVAYTSSNPSVATVSGSTVTIVGGGTTTITASQAGNTNYNAATPVAQSLTVRPAAQSVTLNPFPPRTFGAGPLTAVASASSGLPVTFTSSNTSVATLSGNTVTIVGAGESTITALQAGNANYLAAQATQTLSVNRAEQYISLPGLGERVYGEPPITLPATSSAGLPITYVSQNTAVATFSGNTLYFVGVGYGSISAYQGGNANYNSAYATSSFTVVKATQSVSFTNPGTRTYGDGPFALSASASTGLPITFSSSNNAVATVSGNTVTIVGAGVTTLTATQAGNANYHPQSVSHSLVVNKATPVVYFDSLASVCSFNAIYLGSYTSSSAGLPISYSSSNTSVATISGSYAQPVGYGSTIITASTPATANYNAASRTRTLRIYQAAGTIFVNGDPNICRTGWVELIAGPGTNYNWGVYGNTRSIWAVETGEYSVSYLNTGGCPVSSSVYIYRSGWNCTYARTRDEQAEDPVRTNEVEEEPVKALTAYPNPANDIVTIAMPRKMEVNTPVYLFDLHGRARASGEIKAGEWKTEISIAHIPDGMYLAKVGERNLLNVVKVNVQH
ncbi:MAG TPA: MBG domain-containing protein [Chryseosolibacter sp.]